MSNSTKRLIFCGTTTADGAGCNMTTRTATPGQQLYLSRRLSRLRGGLSSAQHPCPPVSRLIPGRDHTRIASTGTANLETAQAGAKGHQRHPLSRSQSPGSPAAHAPEHSQAQRSLIKPEVLAPAGGWPQLRAAVENGADAVYFGLSAFNARARAINFTSEELPEVQCLMPSAAWHN